MSQSLLIAVVVAVAIVSTLQYQDLVREERRAAEAIVGITEARSDMQIAEDSLQSYALSGEPATLQAFIRAGDAVQRAAARVMPLLDGADRDALTETIDGFRQWYQRAQVEAVQGVLADTATDEFQRGVRTTETSVRADLTRVGDRLDTAAPIAFGSMAAAGIAAVVVAIALARRLTRQVARPMAELAHDTRRLGEGDLGARSAVTGVREIEDIASSFNVMAASLQELDELKSEFVSMVSHELRTPLTSILGYVDALIDEEAGPLNEEQRDYAAAVERNAKRLQALVEDLLTLSRLDAGRMHLDITPVDLGALVSSTCADLGSRAAAKGVTLTVDVDGSPSVEADRARLGQIVTNLVSNAVKFTPGGRAVRVTTRRDGDDALIVVADEGIGIPADEVPRLFERFFRSRTAGTVEGTGLGLAITRELVELQGGALSVDTAEGEGSTFTVRFAGSPPR